MSKRALHPPVDTAGLEGRIARLVSPVRVLSPGCWRLSGVCADSLLNALMFEIDETILPRVIRVVTNRDITVDLHVADRRLMRVVSQPAQGRPEGPESGVKSAAHLMGQLQDIFAGATKAALRSTRAGPVDELSERGCSVSALASAASVQLVQPMEPDPVQGLFSALADRMHAWIVLDPAGNVMKSGGASDWCCRLTDLARDGLAAVETQLSQTLAAPDKPGCILLGQNGGSQLIYARSPDGGFLAAVPAHELPAIQPAWRAFYS